MKLIEPFLSRLVTGIMLKNLTVCFLLITISQSVVLTSYTQFVGNNLMVEIIEEENQNKEGNEKETRKTLDLFLSKNSKYFQFYLFNSRKNRKNCYYLTHVKELGELPSIEYPPEA